MRRGGEGKKKGSVGIEGRREEAGEKKCVEIEGWRERKKKCVEIEERKEKEKEKVGNRDGRKERRSEREKEQRDGEGKKKKWNVNI